MEARFRVIDAGGAELSYASVGDLVAAFRAGRFAASCMLFDARIGRWTPAIEHDAIVAATVESSEAPLQPALKPPLTEPPTSEAPTELHAPTVPETTPAGPEVDPRLDPELAKVRGVEGWLALFALGCVVGPFVMLYNAYSEWSTARALDWGRVASKLPGWPFMLGFEVLGYVLSAAAVFWLFIALMRRRSGTESMAVVILTFLLVFDAVLLALFYSVLGDLPSAADLSESRVGLLRNFIWPLIWLWYFFRSRRVRATFGPVSWSGAMAWASGASRRLRGRA